MGRENPLDHLEARLGRMEEAAREWEMARIGSVLIGRFPDAPAPGAATYATAGLATVELHIAPGEHVALELLLSVRGEPEPYHAAPWMLTLAEHFVTTQDAPRAAERHHLWPLVEGSALDGAVLVAPWRFDEGFGVVADHEDGTPRRVLELVPIAGPEGGFIGEHGWDAFARLAEERGADLLDLRRAPLVQR